MENVKDIDGNSYKTVKIGNQVWMAENLKVTHYRNGDPIQTPKDYYEWRSSIIINSGAQYCVYQNKVNAKNIIAEFGYLYNWEAVNCEWGLAPNGWHIPTDNEWQKLVDYLGGNEIAGGKLKEKETFGSDGLWHTPNTGATNESGFSARPAGYRKGGHASENWAGKYEKIPSKYYYGAFTECHFWTSTKYIDGVAISRRLRNNTSAVTRHKWYISEGYSVRCIKD